MSSVSSTARSASFAGTQTGDDKVMKLYFVPNLPHFSAICNACLPESDRLKHDAMVGTAIELCRPDSDFSPCMLGNIFEKTVAAYIVMHSCSMKLAVNSAA